MASMAPPSTDERTQLLSFLDQQRYAAKLAAYGLSDADAGQAPSASTLSVGGLIRHLAATERSWCATVRRSREVADPADYPATFRFGPADSLADVIGDYDAAAAETDALFASIDDLNAPVPVPKGVPWFPADLEAWTARWVLLHLIEETARHAGHADIVRESLDGATTYPLMAAAEGWEPTPWLQPWQPAATSQSR
jgi:hypothetical protein